LTEKNEENNGKIEERKIRLRKVKKIRIGIGLRCYEERCGLYSG
jgi:hypothetical protein